MNIRPVDLQVLIPRAAEVGKTQQVTDHQVTLQQQQFAEQLQQTMAHRQQQVQSTPKNEGGTVQRNKDDQKEHNRRRDRDKSKVKERANNSAGNSAKPTLEDPNRGHLIDIKT